MSGFDIPLVERIVGALAAVEGVTAIVLGGSHARGTARPDSDIDLGLLYHEARPPDVNALRALAARLDDGGGPVVTEPYGWGPWVNGGAWLRIGGQRVDWIYRSIEHVDRTIDEAERGVWHHHMVQQPPFGFMSVTYLGEVASCRALHDPTGIVDVLKARVATYPPVLRERLVRDCLWQTEFTVVAAAASGARGDVLATAAGLVRASWYLLQALFALNAIYFVSEKTALRQLAAFPSRPERCGERLSRLLAAPGAAPRELGLAVEELAALLRETAALAPTYQPPWSLPG